MADLTTDQRADRIRDRVLGMMHRGAAWAGDGFRDLVRAVLYEFARVEGRVADMLVETDPRRATETLDQWERVFGLPDECGQLATIEARRGAVVARLLDTGSADVGLVESIIGEYPGAEFGGITYRHMMTCEDDCESDVWDQAVAYTPIVKLFEGTGLGAFDFDAVKCGLGRLSVSYSARETGPVFDEVLSNAHSGYSATHVATGSLVDRWVNENAPTSPASDFVAGGSGRPTVSVVGGVERYASTNSTTMVAGPWEQHVSAEAKLVIFACAITSSSDSGMLRGLSSNGFTSVWELRETGGTVVAINRDAAGVQTTAPIPYVPGQLHVWTMRHFRGVLTLTRDGDSAFSASVEAGPTDTESLGVSVLGLGTFNGYWTYLRMLGVDCAMYSDDHIASIVSGLLAS